jgi:hypothetical protein
LAPLAAVTQADNSLEVRTLAKHGGTAITEIIADGDNDLRLVNQATHGGVSHIRIESSARDGGTVRGQIYAGSRNGTQKSQLVMDADGPGAVIDLRDVSVANGGTVDNRKRLGAQGDSLLRWRSQQIAESDGTAKTRQEVDLRAAPGSRNRVDVEILTDGIGHQAAQRLRLDAEALDGGTNEHRLMGGSIAHDGPASIMFDFRHRTIGGVNRSDIRGLDSR